MAVAVICGQTFSDETIDWIQQGINKEPGVSRRALSLRVCGKLGWRSPNGKLKEMSCRIALGKLDRQGRIQLPVAKHAIPRRSSQAAMIVREIEELKDLECSLRELGLIEMLEVSSAESDFSRIWNGMMDRYHYLGRGPLCGAQIRYMIRSQRQGWLGGLSFSAAAWAVRSRDEWIGWRDAVRAVNLTKGVCNSRFLILPQVRVKNLASHVLGMSARRIGGDWERRYGYQPVLLETFVEGGRFKGTSYRAANWIHVGATQGRGRQDRDNRYSKPVKEVYVYPLRVDAKEQLHYSGIVSTAKEAGSDPTGCIGEDSQDWAMDEFGGVELKDKRLQRRVCVIAQDFYAQPQANIPQACGKTSKAKAAYRFFDHEQCKLKTLLKPHYETTVRRIQAAGKKVVLGVQDTSSFNYTTHPGTRGLGTLSSKKDGAMGLEMHDTMAFDEDGVPLGLIDVQLWARQPEEFGKKHQRKELPIESKESYKGLKSFQSLSKIQEQCPEILLVSVGDREADIYELFHLAISQKRGPKLLVRAFQDRLLAEGQDYLWEKVRQKDAAGMQEVMIPRRGECSARVAKLEIRFGCFELRAPKGKPGLGTLKVWAVLAQELGTPVGAESLEWMLLSTIEIDSFEQACRALRWYTKYTRR